MSFILEVYGELIAEIVKIITGKLFTEKQIKTITSHAVGRYFSDLFPKSEDDVEASQKVEKARYYLTEANSILSEMQTELDLKTKNLDALLLEIENKKLLAERYENLAETNKEKFNALKLEMEEALRKQLIAQSEIGRGTRRFVSFLIWLVTIIIGAAFGNYFEEIVTFFSHLF